MENVLTWLYNWRFHFGLLGLGTLQEWFEHVWRKVCFSQSSITIFGTLEKAPCNCFCQRNGSSSATPSVVFVLFQSQRKVVWLFDFNSYNNNNNNNNKKKKKKKKKKTETQHQVLFDFKIQNNIILRPTTGFHESTRFSKNPSKYGKECFNVRLTAFA